jgi:transcriptional regulator with XRE-family HTH domain
MTKPLLPSSKRYHLARAVGQRIRAFRKERGLSENDLAVLVDVQAGRIVAYESGAALPPLYTLVRLSRALRTSVDGLLSEEYAMPMNSQAVIDIFRELSAQPLPVQLSIASFLGQLLGWLKTAQAK